MTSVRSSLSRAELPAGVHGAVAIVAPSRTALGLRAALEAEGLRVVARASSTEALGGLRRLPDVVVLVAHELRAQLVTDARSVRRLVPSARLVVVASTLALRTLRELIAEGVDAVVLERDVERSLGLSVRSACEGQLSFPESMRRSLAKPALSAREKQVLGMVVLGLTNSEIAQKLHLSESTVKSHLSSSFAKLGARSRSEAAQLILDPDTGLGTGILTIAEEG